jgi:acetyl/propionyl-CoA carboxylase alpha subunit
MQEVAFACEDTTVAVRYRVRARDDVAVVVDGSECRAAIHGAAGDTLDLAVDDVRRRYRLVARDDTIWVHSPLGATELRELPRFPERTVEAVQGGCRAPMPGKILAVRVAPGQAVRRGTVLVVLEAMKMEHEVTAPHDGTVRDVAVEPGDQVEAGAVLVVLEEQEVPA